MRRCLALHHRATSEQRAHVRRLPDGWAGQSIPEGEKCAYVTCKADDRFDAIGFAKDALRIWAKAGVNNAGNYFTLIARDYANNGPGKGNTAKSLGTTLDFLILLSKYGSTRPNGRMLETNAVIGKDVPEVFCYIYSNMYSPSSRGWNKIASLWSNEDNHKAAIEGKNGSGPPGLNAQYWDSDDPDNDQTHHFAAYVCHGASHGLNEVMMNNALGASGDYDARNKNILNKGDFYLGWVGTSGGTRSRGGPGTSAGRSRRRSSPATRLSMSRCRTRDARTGTASIEYA